jgi:hypothetical protein
MSIVDEGNAIAHDAHGSFGLRHKISSSQQFTVHICLLLTPHQPVSKYTLIIFQMNRKKQHRHIDNAHAKKEHFEDHMEILHFDQSVYQVAYQAYKDYVWLANELFAGRTTFWD